MCKQRLDLWTSLLRIVRVNERNTIYGCGFDISYLAQVDTEGNDEGSQPVLLLIIPHPLS